MSGTTWVSRERGRQNSVDWSTAHARPGASPRRPVSNSPVRAAVPPELQDHLGALVFSLTVDFTSTHRTISSQCGNRSRKRCSRAHSLICRRPSWGCSTGLSHMSTLKQSLRPGGWNALVNQAFCLERGWASLTCITSMGWRRPVPPNKIWVLSLQG